MSGVYWFDRYRVEDFAQEPAALDTIAQPSFLIIGYAARPDSTHTLVARLTHLW